MRLLTHPKDPRPTPQSLKGRRKQKASLRRRLMSWTEKDEWRVQNPDQQDDYESPAWAHTECQCSECVEARFGDISFVREMPLRMSA